MVAMAEPETPRKKRNWYLTAFGVLWGFWFGYAGFSAFRQHGNSEPQSAAEAEQQSKVWARASFLQQELSEIRSRPNPTVDDYIKNTRESEPLISEAKALVPFQRASVMRAKQLHPDNKVDAVTTDYLLRVVDKGEQMLYLEGNEVDCANALQFVPAAHRAAYYQDKVPPLKEQERQVVKELYAIVMEGKAKGVPWPDSMVKSLKALQ
jgi:hypothetical protein